jgi:hypothetical protein
MFITGPAQLELDVMKRIVRGRSGQEITLGARIRGLLLGLTQPAQAAAGNQEPYTQ